MFLLHSLSDVYDAVFPQLLNWLIYSMKSFISSCFIEACIFVRRYIKSPFLGTGYVQKWSSHYMLKKEIAYVDQRMLRPFKAPHMRPQSLFSTFLRVLKTGIHISCLLPFFLSATFKDQIYFARYFSVILQGSNYGLNYETMVTRCLTEREDAKKQLRFLK